MGHKNFQEPLVHACDRFTSRCYHSLLRLVHLSAPLHEGCEHIRRLVFVDEFGILRTLTGWNGAADASAAAAATAAAIAIAAGAVLSEPRRSTFRHL